MSKVFSVRLGDELGARFVAVAEAQGVKAPSLLKAAVESYLDGYERGLPDAPAEAVAAQDDVNVGRQRRIAHAERVLRAAGGETWRANALARQARLNEGKERSK